MKTDHPFFSIITASLNCVDTIQETIDSVAGQTFQHIEHIIIDGGSTDGTPDILKSYQRGYNLFWISEPDKGIADALNKGMKMARGSYILVVQADDRLVSPNILCQIYPLLKDERSDIYSFPVILENNSKERTLLKPIKVRWWYHFKTILLHQGSFIHRRLYERVGHYRTEFSISMDYDFFYRAIMDDATLHFEEIPVAFMGTEGISRDRDLLTRRIREEAMVQRMNERTKFWRFAQVLFHSLYFPYKTRILPLLAK